jgi:putative transposase
VARRHIPSPDDTAMDAAACGPPKFSEHTLEPDGDFERHFDDVHYNPVPHGCAGCPADWPASSLHRWMAAGGYTNTGAAEIASPLNFDDVEKSVGE